MKQNGFLTIQICDILGISERSIRRWENNVEEYGDVIPPHNPSQGRPFTLTGMQISDLIDLIMESPELFLDEIHDWILISQDINLTVSAIHKIIKDLGFSYKYLRKVAAERDDEARRVWMDRIKNHYVAEQLVFVDESSKDNRVIFRRFGRAPKGQRAEVETDFVRGTRYSIIAAITLGGYIAVRVIENSVDGPEFLDYIAEEVVSLFYIIKLPFFDIHVAAKNESLSTG